MGKVLPKWVIYNIIHTHARTVAVGSAEASPLPSRSSCFPCLGPAPSFSREERTNKILGRGRGLAGGWMLRDFLGSGHCESVFGWVFSLPTPPWLLIWTGFPFLRCIQEKDTRVYNVNCNRLLVYFVILFFFNCTFNLQDATFSDSSDFKSTGRICI